MYKKGLGSLDLGLRPLVFGLIAAHITEPER